ncbi:MAG: bifunctional heptose 7-phosphate kinase/heptose 1-phosphate adenyltransferase, partial [Planctomycetaceae bacterium]|nr:bifunctional heptose 7-phosphate kinase/heptose 1-phosphate adenyltransferase [Planctomycetaceae bacterium]
MNTRLVEIVGRLKRPRIFVLGDLILDKYVWGAVSRISPEAPVPVVAMRNEEYRPGGASNVVTNLAALDARVACGGVIGRDEAGRVLERLLRERGGTPAVIRDAGKPTSLKTRMMAHHQQMLRVDQEVTTPIPPAVQARLLAAALRQAATADLAIISDYSKGTLPPELCQRFIRGAKCPVLVGLKSHDHRKYAKATGASLNRSELR